MKTKTFKTKPEIKKGSIVKHGQGWQRVRARFENSVNLGSIFGSKTTLKKVPIADVTEDEAAWYAWWQTTETYQCM